MAPKKSVTFCESIQEFYDIEMCDVTAAVPEFRCFQQQPEHAATPQSNSSGDHEAELVIVDDGRDELREPLTDEGQLEMAMKDGDISLPLWTMLLSLFFPVAGCIGFVMCLNSAATSKRHVWAVRSLYAGCFLAVVYAIIIVCLLSQFHFPWSEEKNVKFGAGF